ncbi:26S proteasome non-ATPase regulatory subunit 5 [Anopheles nili]|uniref:26S proteasome non-ATPase regulatory subunit 5 n=1 Tax=Anopheles nili TaxID=185578 RepID=UPI00237A7127|nr:26S proteasome non-ATPase regulatory subunit 5 [Anopheles nili]
MDVNQLESLMRNLAIKETRTNSLDMLESKLADVDPEIFKVMLCSDSLFKFLADANSDQHTTASRIIYDKAIEFFPNGSPVVDQFIERCLTHPKSTVKQFGMRGAATMVYDSTGISSNNVQLVILHCLPMKEVYVNTLVNVLVKSLPPVFAEVGVQKNLLSVLEYDGTIRCRVYEIVCTILEKHPVYLPIADPIIKRALADLDGTDVLLQTSVLPILTQLLVTKEGFDYVEAIDLFNKVYTNFVTVKMTPYLRFVLPNALKFYANAAAVQPVLFLSRYSKAVDFIFENTLLDDSMLMAIAYDCLGMIGSTSEGKIHLYQHKQEKMNPFLKQLPGVISSTTEACKVRFIECLASLMSLENGQFDNRISDITQRWYETMTESEDLEMILELFKVPFPNQKMATLKLLSAIVDHRWGQLFFQNTACFAEILLNRMLDVDVNVTQFKYDVIKKLSQSTVMENFLLDMLKQYVSETAFHQKAQVEVVIEGGQ